MIRKATYKDRPCIVVESEKLIATFLYEDGAKLCSLVRKKTGKELMATADGEKYKRLTFDGSYVDSECSAFDDMFPTIDPYTPKSGVHAGLEYPDHGETCRIPFTPEPQGDTAHFSAHSHRFAVRYEKSARASEDGGIEISYRFINESDEDFDFVWAGHIMLAGEDGMKINSPYGDDSHIEMIFTDGNESGAVLPRDTLVGFDKGRGAAYKFYYTEQIITNGFSVSYKDGSTLSFSYDKEKLPYFGVWLNNGFFKGTYTLTPEPCSVPFDAPDKARARGYRSFIKARGSFEFTIHINID